MSAASKAASALSSIPCTQCSYDEWKALAMAYRSAGGTLDEWIMWCKSDPERYDEKAARAVFDNPTVGIAPSGVRPITDKTLWWHARNYGWTWKDQDTPALENRAACWNKEHASSNCTAAKLARRLSPAEQAAAQIDALFKPHESICIVTSTQADAHGKFRPADGGKVYNAGALSAKLRESNDIESALGCSYDHQAGAWIRINPVKGKGTSDSDVAAWRHALIESDELPVSEQRALMLKLGFPASSLVSSGGKSVHALVRVDADSPRHYAACTARLHRLCSAAGLKADRANRNPSRLTRLAGAQRGQAEQTLLCVNVGATDFESWAFCSESAAIEKPQEAAKEDGGLPPISKLDLTTEINLKPELIHGVLRIGHKMIICGPSKAYKSYCLIQLAQAIAVGDKWLGFKCTIGRVLYLNFEIDAESFRKRMADVARRKGYAMPAVEDNISVWNLRGHSEPLDSLAPKIINSAKAAGGFDLIIVDPIYKIMCGDENSARDVGAFCSALDMIATELTCSLAYCHHHSKGLQSLKNAQDRASGSGVFGRDADALLDIIALEVPDEVAIGARLGEHDTVWQVSSVLREFPPVDPFAVVFSWPVHVRDFEGSFSECRPLTASMQGGRARAAQRESENASKIQHVDATVERLMKEQHADQIKAATLFAELEWQERTVKKWLGESKLFRLISENRVQYIERKCEYPPDAA